MRLTPEEQDALRVAVESGYGSAHDHEIIWLAATAWAYERAAKVGDDRVAFLRSVGANDGGTLRAMNQVTIQALVDYAVEIRALAQRD